jgi:hypothetical protein
MKLSDAKIFGKSYTDEKTGVTLWMHPSTSMRFYDNYDALRKAGVDTTTPITETFVYADGLLLAIESDRTDLTLQAYLDLRDGKTALERYELFITLVDFEYNRMVISAFTATRHEEFPSEIPPEIASDPQAKKNGSSATIEKKSKSKAK